MPDSDKPLTLDDLPPKIRQDLLDQCARLPPEFKYRNLRETKLGWALSIYDENDHYGGDIGVLRDQEVNPNPPWLHRNSPL